MALLGALGWSQARAKEDPLLQALAQLTPYDLEGDRTVETLRHLGEQIERLPPRRAAELDFLHAVASVDMLIAARLLGNEALEAKIADANGGSPESVRQVLIDELSSVDSGVMHETAADCLSALRLMGSKGADLGAMWQKSSGPRHDMLFIAEVRRRVAGDGDLTAALAPLSDDPCGTKRSCDAFAYLTEDGRRAAATLMRAGRVARELGNANGEDPLVSAVAEHLPDLDELTGVVLSPVPSLKAAPQATPAGVGGKREVPELLVFVTPTAVHFSIAPKLRLNDKGELEAFASGEPVFPATREMKLPNGFVPFLRPVHGVKDVFAEIATEHAGKSMAIAASPDTPSHVWARVILTARSVGFRKPSMLAIADDGSPRVLDIDVFTAHQAEKAGPREVTVMVRLGGYSVRRQGPTVMIPRLAVESGWKFDLDALVRRVPRESVQSAKMHFMPDVPSATLHTAAFAVAPKRNKLALILP